VFLEPRRGRRRGSAPAGRRSVPHPLPGFGPSAADRLRGGRQREQAASPNHPLADRQPFPEPRVRRVALKAEFARRSVTAGAHGVWPCADRRPLGTARRAPVPTSRLYRGAGKGPLPHGQVSVGRLRTRSSHQPVDGPHLRRRRPLTGETGTSKDPRLIHRERTLSVASSLPASSRPAEPFSSDPANRRGRDPPRGGDACEFARVRAKVDVVVDYGLWRNLRRLVRQNCDAWPLDDPQEPTRHGWCRPRNHSAAGPAGGACTTGGGDVRRARPAPEAGRRGRRPAAPGTGSASRPRRACRCPRPAAGPGPT
jgi:hypothetical protein